MLGVSVGEKDGLEDVGFIEGVSEAANVGRRDGSSDGARVGL